MTRTIKTVIRDAARYGEGYMLDGKRIKPEEIYKKERPILFSGPMVRAILEGHKTQTRRVIKNMPKRPYPIGIAGSIFQFDEKLNSWQWWAHERDAFWRPRGDAIKCPYGQPGDRLWIRETFTIETNFNLDPCDPPFKDERPVKWTESEDWGRYWEQCHYRATEPEHQLVHEDDCRKCEDDGYCNSWSPSIHMPRWASRITLEITNVRVERIQDINELDTLAEGIHVQCSDEDMSEQLEAFEDLWDSINAKRGFGWDKNPWVWVIEFRRLPHG